MTAPAGGRVAALVTHARQVPAAERSRFAAEARRAAAVSGGILLVETCHRVEAWAGSAGELSAARDSLPDGGALLAGEAAVRHAIGVAVGRDSVVVGEDQVLHQLRRSLAAAGAGGVDPVLERLFGLALRAGRRARSWRQGPPRSLADLALAAIERSTGSPSAGLAILAVGAGAMGRLTVRAAQAAGATVAIANRTRGRSAALAARFGAGLVDFDPGPGVGRYDGVVVALGGPWSIGRPTAAALAAASTVVVDLSVPAAVDGSLAAALGPRLVSADDLALLGAGDAPAGGQDPASAARLDDLIDATAAEFQAWLDGRSRRAAAGALAEHADREREAELADLWRRLPRLDPEARVAIDRMSRHLAERLLREPLERLGRDQDGRHERAARELFGL